jgi:hypothetical protein
VPPTPKTKLFSGLTNFQPSDLQSKQGKPISLAREAFNDTMIRTIRLQQSAFKRRSGASVASSCRIYDSERRTPTRVCASDFSSIGGSSPEDRLLVVGSGVAGSAAALIAAETYKIPVTLLFAGNLPQDCNSNWAQGGIIYRNYDPASGDSADSLANDIHRAGAGLCDDAAVRKVAEEGPDRVRQLLLNGEPYADVPFDKRPDGELSLCLGKLSFLSLKLGEIGTYIVF